jgi:hypothetical protein
VIWRRSTEEWRRESRDVAPPVVGDRLKPNLGKQFRSGITTFELQKFHSIGLPSISFIDFGTLIQNLLEFFNLNSWFQSYGHCTLLYKKPVLINVHYDQQVSTQ